MSSNLMQKAVASKLQKQSPGPNLFLFQSPQGHPNLRGESPALILLKTTTEKKDEQLRLKALNEQVHLLNSDRKKQNEYDRLCE